MKAQYHKENNQYRVVVRGTLFYAQRFIGRGTDRDGNNKLPTNLHDAWADLHRGTDYDTAMQQMGAAVASAKRPVKA